MKAQSWPDLFTKSSFYFINKEEELAPEIKKSLLKVIYDKAVDNYHENRKADFLLGRLAASMAHEQCFGEELLSIPVNKDRSPEWPLNAVGSISHSQHWVGAAVAKKSDLIGVGIDFEVKERAKLKLSSHIRSKNDLLSHPKLSESELLTLIFSSKESLYKALHPTVKIFFGFHDAALVEINPDKGTFTLELLTKLSEEFGPENRHLFEGRFATDLHSCVTVVEIPHSK